MVVPTWTGTKHLPSPMVVPHVTLVFNSHHVLLSPRCWPHTPPYRRSFNGITWRCLQRTMVGESEPSIPLAGVWLPYLLLIFIFILLGVFDTVYMKLKTTESWYPFLFHLVYIFIAPVILPPILNFCSIRFWFNWIKFKLKYYYLLLVILN